MMSAVIEASGLGKAYRRTWALRDCTLAIPGGRVVGLVGPNGAGKTTLLRLATGQLETGTADLAWNQSVTRTRWLAVKLTVIGLTAIAVTEALSLMQTWWAAPISQAAADVPAPASAQGRFSQLNFASHGITPLGYAAFAFVLGVTAGALIRRTIPAMAVTLAIFAALQVAMPLWVRPNLAPPDHTVIPVTRERRTVTDRPGRRQIHVLRRSTSPASPAPGSCPAGPSTPPGRRPAPPRPPAHR